MTSQENQSSIPLIIGVSGHRDISNDDIGKCREKTRSILNYFLKSYPSTPIIVLSPLAEGADRLVAEEVIKIRDAGESRICIIAPLPFDQAVYEQDFDEASIQQFRHLLGQVDEYFAIESYAWQDFDAEKISRGEGVSAPERKAQYANIGAFIARHSNILLALWDGNFLIDKPGGTGHVVQLMLNGDMFWGEGVPERPEFKRRSLVSGGEHGVIIHLPVERVGGSNDGKIVELEDQGAGVAKWTRKHKLPNGINWYFTGLFDGVSENKDLLEKIVSTQKTEFVKTLQQINQFNVDAAKVTSSKGFLYSESKLLSEDAKPSAPLNDNEVRIQQLNQVAASLARSNQGPMNLTITLYFIAVALMAVGYDSFAEQTSVIALIAMGAFLVGALGIGAVATVSYFRKYKQKQHDYRALAEMLRVMFYLVHCRLNHTIDEFYGSDTRNMTSWIEHARRYLEIGTWKKQDSLSKEEAIARLGEVNDWWLAAQKRYFANAVEGGGNSRGLQHKVTAYRYATYGVYVAAVITLLSMSWFYLVESAEWVVTFWSVAGALFALLGLVAKWFEVHGYEEDLNRYADALDLFRRGEYELSHRLTKQDVERANLVVKEIAIHALEENENWYLTHLEKCQ